MKSIDGDQVQCPCCKECKDCTTDFQKVLDLKNAGLIIYRHTANTEDVNKYTGIIEYATKTTEDVFVLHNTKDIELTSADYLPEIERNTTNCPRCRRIIEHALKLLQKVPTINRNDVKGICEHCRTKEVPCFKCEEVVKKFVVRKSERTENTKERVKQWLSKIKHLLRDAVLDTKTGKQRVRAHSELHIDQLCRESPKPGREPEVKQMFSSETDFVGAFPSSIENRSKMFAYFPQSEKLKSTVVFLDPQEKFRKPSTSKTNERLNITDRDEVNVSDADSDIIYTLLTEKERQKREKHVELRIPPVPFHSEVDFLIERDDSIMDFERDILKATRLTSRSYTSDKDVNADTKRFIQTGKATSRGDISSRREKFDVKSETMPAFASKLYKDMPDQINSHFSLGSVKATTEKEILGKTGALLNIIRKYNSEEALLTTVVSVTEEVIDQDFSYVFPKTLSPDKKKLKRQKSSSELIKDTQDMLLTKAEEAKKRLEEERKRKLEEEERKKIAREERRKQLETKRKADEERKLLEAAEKVALAVKRKKEQKEIETKSEIEKKYTKDDKDEPNKDTPIASPATSKKKTVTQTASTATSKTKIKESRSALVEKIPKEQNEPKEIKEHKEANEPKELKRLTDTKEPKEAKITKDQNETKKQNELQDSKISKEQYELKEVKIPKGPHEEPKEGKELKGPKEPKIDIDALKTVKDTGKAKKEQYKKENPEIPNGEKEVKQQEKGEQEKVKGDKQHGKEKNDSSQADKNMAEVRARDEAKLQFNNVKDVVAEANPEPEKSTVPKKEEETNMKALNIKSIKVRGLFPDDAKEQEKKEERQKKEKKVRDEQSLREKELMKEIEKDLKQQDKNELQGDKLNVVVKQKGKEKEDPVSKLRDQEGKAKRAEKNGPEKIARDEPVPKKEEETNIKALNIKSIKVRGLIPDDDKEHEKKGDRQNKEKKVKGEQSLREKELMKQIEKDLKQQDKNELQGDKLNVVVKQKGKEREDPASKLKDQEDNAKRAEQNGPVKKARDEPKLKSIKETKVEAKSVPEIVEAPKNNELNIKSIKVRTPSPDDLILRLVKIKQSTGAHRVKPKKLSEMGLFPKDVKTHKSHNYKKTDACVMCQDSDFELDAESIVKIKVKDKIADIIIGPKIFKCKPKQTVQTDKRDDKQDVVPILFQSTFDAAKAPAEVKEVAMPHHEAEKSALVLTPGKQVQGNHVVEQEAPKGVIRYALSDRSFIDKGWTMLPTEKVVRKMNVYRMRPAQPEFDWFEHNKNKRLMQYDSGEKLAEFDDNGRGRWFYKNGRMALDYYDAEELNAQQRFVIYSSGDPDERGRAQPYTLLATFDYLGNGIVFDHSGKIRLKYNQTEGVVLDRSIGPVSHWKWHTLNDPPVLQQVMIDTQMAHKDPGILKLGGLQDDKTRPDNEDMLTIEFDNFIKEKSKKLTQTFKPFQIKMKALKINEHFSLKVLDQATVYLIFRDGTTNLKLNIGMVLDHKEIVDTDTAEVGEVSNNMERLPARTDSLAGLQKSIAHAQHYERMRTERERRLCTAAPSGSADKLTAAASRPMRLPLRTGPSSSTATAANSYCKCSRKPTASNVYYDSRLC